MEDENWIGTKGVKVLDACIYPDTDKEGIEEDDLFESAKRRSKPIIEM